MDATGIRTSFIPKAPLSGKFSPQREGMGFFMFLSIAILVVSAVGWGAAYTYRTLLENDLRDLEGYLSKAKESFDPSLLKVFENLDRRLRTADTLLGQHTVATPFFSLLDSLTLKSVRFDFFSYTNNGSAIAVKLSGEALDFPSVALQALEFNKDGRFQNPIFSNLGVEEDTGRVTFDVSFNVDPVLVSYSEKLNEVPTL